MKRFKYRRELPLLSVEGNKVARCYDIYADQKAGHIAVFFAAGDAYQCMHPGRTGSDAAR